jgi:hypothetical protein
MIVHRLMISRLWLVHWEGAIIGKEVAVSCVKGNLGLSEVSGSHSGKDAYRCLVVMAPSSSL